MSQSSLQRIASFHRKFVPDGWEGVWVYTASSGHILKLLLEYFKQLLSVTLKIALLLGNKIFQTV